MTVICVLLRPPPPLTRFAARGTIPFAGTFSCAAGPVHHSLFVYATHLENSATASSQARALPQSDCRVDRRRTVRERLRLRVPVP